MLTNLPKINLWFFVFILICFFVTYLLAWITGSEYSTQSFKDVLLYAIVWRVIANEVNNG